LGWLPKELKDCGIAMLAHLCNIVRCECIF